MNDIYLTHTTDQSKLKYVQGCTCVYCQTVSTRSISESTIDEPRTVSGLGSTPPVRRLHLGPATDYADVPTRLYAKPNRILEEHFGLDLDDGIDKPHERLLVGFAVGVIAIAVSALVFFLVPYWLG